MALFDKAAAHSAKWEPSIDPTIPAWKRELILKKRAHGGRSLPSGQDSNEPWATSGGSEARSKWQPQSAVHPKGYTASGLHGSGAKQKEATRLRGSSIDGHSQLLGRAARARSASVSSVPVGPRPSERPLRPHKMVEEGEGQGEGNAPSPSFSSFSDGFAYEYDEATSSDEQEYEYGPGIVDRLRWKFINLTVRDQDAFVGRPVRRVASLEHLLHDEGIMSDPRSKRKFATVSGKAVAPSKVRKLDILKKAYSMETLTAIDQLGPANGNSRHDENDHPNLLVNENVVIIDQPKRSRSSDLSGVPLLFQRDLGKRHGSISIEEGELPPPDTVRTYKKIFESGVSKESRQPRIKSGIAAKIAIHKTLVAKAGQPVKKPPSAKVSWVEEAAASGLLKKNANDVGRVAEPQVELEEKPLTNGNHREIKTEIENSAPSLATKKISVESLQRIREASEVNNYNFGSKSKPRESHTTPSQSSETTSVTFSGTPNRPRVVDIKPKTDEKPIGLIKPLPAAVPVEQKENLINQVKTAMAKSGSGTIGIVNGTIDCNASTEKGSNKIGLKKVNAPLPEPTTMVFNFTDKTDVTPKITNTQSNFSVQRPLVRIDRGSGKLVSNLFQGSEASAIVFIPGMTTTVSSDFDEEDDSVASGEPILPCGIEFEGENVIVGRTCLLQKRNKQLKISFDDNSTETYEYPSEMVILEEYDDEAIAAKRTEAPSPTAEEMPSNLGASSTPSTGLMSTPALSSSGGLANYIPSKLSDGEKFELGVSRPAEPPQPAPTTTSSGTTELEEMVIKPAGDEASSWSSSQTSAADILF